MIKRFLRVVGTAVLYAALSAAIKELATWPQDVPTGLPALAVGVALAVLLAIDKYVRDRRL